MWNRQGRTCKFVKDDQDLALLHLSKSWSLPLVNKPWFTIPSVSEWEVKTGPGVTRIKAIRYEEHRVRINDLPSVFGMDPVLLHAMYEYDVYRAEKEAEAYEEAKR